MGFCSFVPIDPMNVRTKFEVQALPVPEIIKILAVPGYAHAPFSPKFYMGVCRMDPVNAPAKFEVRSFTHS